MRISNRECVLILCVVITSGCGDTRQPIAGPSSPPIMQSPLSPTSNNPNWTADATVIAVKAGGTPPCGWGTAAGEARSGVLWQIARTGDQILLDEDMRNWSTDDLPFSGKLTGRQFAASYWQGNDYARYVCQFREASLSGTFSEDGASFEAMETLVWGIPGSETIVQRKWVGRRL